MEDLAAVRPDHLRPHARRRSRKKCGKCTWARKGGALRSECLIEGTERQTWLACVSVLPDASDLANKALRRVLRLGCVVCHAYRRNMVQNTENGDGSGLDKGRSAVDQNVFGRFAQPLSLLFRRGALWSCRKHSKTRIHQEALQAWHDKSKSACLAPPRKDFEKALEGLRKGRSARDGGGSSDQATLTRWCLTEACLQEARSALRTCKSLVIIRDERAGKLMLRFRATLRDMSVLTGVLGLQDLSCGLQTFATEQFQPPRGFRVVVPAEELLFPNAKIVGRDRAHACQRVLSHPWGACRAVQSLLEETVLGKNSVCQKIDRSHTFSSWFADAVAQSELSRGKTLSAAKHRFCSYSKPLGRIVLHLDSMIAVLNRIASSCGDDARWAPEWMASINPERAILLGMCADLADSCMQLTRYFDDESLDIARINEEALFSEGQCFHVHGFTKHCLDILQQNRLVMFFDGRARALGGSADGLAAAKRAALRKMQACVELCKEAVRAEFPSFHAIMAFKVFSVSEGAATSHSVSANLTKLAKLFKVDPVALEEEFQMVFPVAAVQQQATGCSNRQAWQYAFRRAAASATTHWRTESLQPVLSAYLCWTTSSSGVEQTFSKVERCHLHRGNGQNDAFRRAVVGLTSADPDSKVVHGDEAVISSARALFSAGRSRQTRNNAAGRKQRLDKGTGKFKVKASAAATPRGGTRRGVPQTEAAWLRRRRAELDAVISTPQPKSQSQNQSNAEWTPDMEKEKKRLGKVSEQLRVEAHGDGYLLDEEKPSEQNVVAQARRDATNDRKRKREETNRANLWHMAQEKKDFAFFSGLVTGADVWIPQPTLQERHKLISWGAHRVSSELEGCSVFVVNHEDPEPRARWHALLKGKTLLSRAVFLAERGQARTFCVSYVPAEKRTTALHVTQSFAKRSPQVASFLGEVCESPGTKWLQCADKNAAQVVLCQLVEVSGLKKTGRRHVCTAEGLMAKLGRACIVTSKSGHS
ncbi:unnamed protein product [Effrenium voratum]|nr:unnamed protein product [Effrenium voratum]